MSVQVCFTALLMAAVGQGLKKAEPLARWSSIAVKFWLLGMALAKGLGVSGIGFV